MSTVVLTIVISIITAVPPTLAAIFAWMVARKNTRKIQEIHVSLNSRLSQLLDLTAASSHAQGVSDEKDRPKSTTHDPKGSGLVRP